jgi:hypothetical protein
MDAEAGGQRGSGLQAFEGFEGDVGFEVGGAFFALWHLADPF